MKGIWSYSKIFFAIGVLSGIAALAVLGVVAAYTSGSLTNVYGGRNETSYVDDYHVVRVHDQEGKVLCSYPIKNNIDQGEAQKFDCPEDLEPKIFVGD